LEARNPTGDGRGEPELICRVSTAVAMCSKSKMEQNSETSQNHSNGKSRNRKRKKNDSCNDSIGEEVHEDPLLSSSPKISAVNDFLIFPDRGSHFRLLKSRNWKAVNDYWHSITQSGRVPVWISSPSGHSYGVTDLEAIHQCALDEMELFGKNIQRKTYAVRVGYAGSHYQVLHWSKELWVITFIVGISITRKEKSLLNYNC
jgi:hypothetical protein